jgi:hypothetical protein
LAAVRHDGERVAADRRACDRSADEVDGLSGLTIGDRTAQFRGIREVQRSRGAAEYNILSQASGGDDFQSAAVDDRVTGDAAGEDDLLAAAADRVVPLAEPPDSIFSVPPPIVVVLTVPTTSSSPPLVTAVLTAVPPEETTSRPPLLTIAPLAVPLGSTMSSPPAPIVKDERAMLPPLTLICPSCSKVAWPLRLPLTTLRVPPGCHFGTQRDLPTVEAAVCLVCHTSATIS